MTAIAPVPPPAVATRAGGQNRDAALRALVRLGRPKFLLNSLLLVLIGTFVAIYQGYSLNWRALVLVQLFAWCTHLMTHYCNEYFDLEADRANESTGNWSGGSRVLVSGQLDPTVSLTTAGALLLVDVLLLAEMPSTTARMLAFVDIAVAWLYTAPPLRLNYHRLGEVSCAAALNVVLPVLACLSQESRVSMLMLVISGPVFVLQTARMAVMNLADREADLRVGKHTLATLLGHRGTAIAFGSLQLLAYGGLVVLAVTGSLPWLLTGPLLATAVIGALVTNRLLRRPPDAGLDGTARLASIHIVAVGYAILLGLLIGVAVGRGANLLFCVLAVFLFTVLFAVQQRPARARSAPFEPLPTDSA